MLTPAGYRLIDLLMRHGSMTVVVAADLRGSNVSSVSRMRVALVEAGYLADYKDWEDPMVITDDGRQAHDAFENQ